MAKYGIFKYGSGVKYGLGWLFRKVRFTNILDSLGFDTRLDSLILTNIEDSVTFATSTDSLSFANEADSVTFTEVNE